MRAGLQQQLSRVVVARAVIEDVNLRRLNANVHRNKNETGEKWGRCERKRKFEFAYFDYIDGEYWDADFGFVYDHDVVVSIRVGAAENLNVLADTGEEVSADASRRTAKCQNINILEGQKNRRLLQPIKSCV